MPSKSPSFTPSSILFRPRRNPHGWAWVEAPGTAPGSEGFIPMAVYRHSRSFDRQTQYRRSAPDFEGDYAHGRRPRTGREPDDAAAPPDARGRLGRDGGLVRDRGPPRGDARRPRGGAPIRGPNLDGDRRRAAAARSVRAVALAKTLRPRLARRDRAAGGRARPPPRGPDRAGHGALLDLGRAGRSSWPASAGACAGSRTSSRKARRRWRRSRSPRSSSRPCAKRRSSAATCRRARKRSFPPAASIALPAVLFALAHFGGNFAQPAIVFMLGVLAGYLRRVSGSLVPGMALHAVNNGCLVLLLALTR